MQYFSNNSPFYKLPNNSLKLKVIFSTIDPEFKSKPVISKLCEFIDDAKLNQMHCANPPYYLRVENVEQLRIDIEYATVKCKSLIDILLRTFVVKAKKNKSNAVTDKVVADIITDKVADIITDKVADIVADEVADIITDKVADIITDKVADVEVDKVVDVVADEMADMDNT